MSWRIAIEHSTTHRYATEVFHSYNEARLVPRTLPGQVCLEVRVNVEPRAQLFRYPDYWGSVVDCFDIHASHACLRVESNATVETAPLSVTDPGMSWDEIAAHAITERYAELLAPTPFVPSFAGAAEELRALGPPSPAAAARLAADWVRDQLHYEVGATDVTTPADDALSRGKGVCQDFAHLTLGLLRSLGIPGRYVSGYLHPLTDAQIGETVEGQGHAWVEWWCGAWMAWDPTHGEPIGHRHVLVGRGRDYGDVPPLKGVYQGAPSVAHEVAIAITRTA
jgi:transglutaminase-like putative cysteine protease